MQFAIICVVALVALGVVAAVVSALTPGGTDEPVNHGGEAHDCASCSELHTGECRIACLIEEKKARDKGNKTQQK